MLRYKYVIPRHYQTLVSRADVRGRERLVTIAAIPWTNVGSANQICPRHSGAVTPRIFPIIA